MLESALRLFEPYWKKRQLALIKRECEQLRKVLDEFLEDVRDEQQEHLRIMRLSGPWSADWEQASRQRDQLARKVLRRLRRYNCMQEHIRLLPEGDASRTFYDRIRRLFGSDETLLIALVSDDVFSTDTLRQIDRLTHRLAQVDGVHHAESPTDPTRDTYLSTLGFEVHRVWN